MKVVGRQMGYLLLGLMSMVVLGMAPTASGQTVLNITNANCGLSCGIVPPNTVIGTVSMNLNASGSVTVTVALNPGFTFIVPDGNDINFDLGNANAGNVSVTNFFSSTSGAPGTYTNPLVFSGMKAGTNVGSGFGPMNVTLFHIQDIYKPQQPLQYISFTLSLNNGQFNLQNLANALWAFHLGNCPQPANGCNATTTGFVGTSTPTTVPEPGSATLAIFGLGLLFAGNFVRRRFSRSAPA